MLNRTRLPTIKILATLKKNQPTASRGLLLNKKPEDSMDVIQSRMAVQRAYFLDTPSHKHAPMSFEKSQLIYKKLGIGFSEEELIEISKRGGKLPVLPKETAERIIELSKEDPIWKKKYEQACRLKK